MKEIYIVLSVILVLIIINNYDEIKIWILNRIIVERGILAPNCFWYQISDLLLSDGAGINLYNDLQKKYGDFAETNMFDKKIYIVMNVNYIRTILDNSPHTFSVGELKKTFFKSFMEKNVGVSAGCPWKRRRKINEVALDTDKLHRYSEKYNHDIREKLFEWKNKSEFEFIDFLNFGKYLVARIVFNTDHIDDDVFQIFSEANTLEVFSNPEFKINPKIYNKFIDTVNYYIDNPNPESLIELCLSVSDNKEEVLHQIPHFMFPFVAISVSVVPRLLVLLFNHKDILNKVIQEINSVEHGDYVNIYQLTYLRKCILESIRLNNLVITTFRTLTQDFTFDEKHSFQKGTQFLILNNPVLRDKDYFEKPNEFIPERWTPEMELSYYAISFNQGPQRCPGKELSIYVVQCFIYNFFKIKNININTEISVNKINPKDIPQVINPCSIHLRIN